MDMLIREALPLDIPAIQRVRNAVLENRLSDPRLVSDADCYDYIVNRGKGWVCEIAGAVAGFAIVDLRDSNVWALFLDPAMQHRGIGRQLHDVMLNWYFSMTNNPLWLSTAPGTRAVGFYRRAGWKDAGFHGKELRFEMHFSDWENHTW